MSLPAFRRPGGPQRGLKAVSASRSRESHRDSASYVSRRAGHVKNAWTDLDQDFAKPANIENTANYKEAKAAPPAVATESPPQEIKHAWLCLEHAAGYEGHVLRRSPKNSRRSAARRLKRRSCVHVCIRGIIVLKETEAVARAEGPKPRARPSRKRLP